MTTTICKDCRHEAACGVAEVEACANYAEPHWADAIPTMERVEKSDGETEYISATVKLADPPGCSCKGLRDAQADVARLAEIATQARSRGVGYFSEVDEDGYPATSSSSTDGFCSVCDRGIDVGDGYCRSCGTKIAQG